MEWSAEFMRIIFQGPNYILCYAWINQAIRQFCVVLYIGKGQHLYPSKVLQSFWKPFAICELYGFLLLTVFTVGAWNFWALLKSFGRDSLFGFRGDICLRKKTSTPRIKGLDFVRKVWTEKNLKQNYKKSETIFFFKNFFHFSHK